MWTMSLLTPNMKSVKQIIINMKNQNKPMKEIVKTSGGAKSTVWHILKKKTHWVNSETTAMDDRVDLAG